MMIRNYKYCDISVDVNQYGYGDQCYLYDTTITAINEMINSNKKFEEKFKGVNIGNLKCIPDEEIPEEEAPEVTTDVDYVTDVTGDTTETVTEITEETEVPEISVSPTLPPIIPSLLTILPTLPTINTTLLPTLPILPIISSGLLSLAINTSVLPFNPNMKTLPTVPTSRNLPKLPTLPLPQLPELPDQLLPPCNSGPLPVAAQRLKDSLPAAVFAKYFPKFASNRWTNFDHVFGDIDSDCNAPSITCRKMPIAPAFTDPPEGRRQYQAFGSSVGGYTITPLVDVGQDAYQTFMAFLNSLGYCSPFV